MKKLLLFTMITLSALFFTANAQTLNAFSTQNITYQSADASFFLNPNCANGATFNVEYSTNAGFSSFTNAGGGSVANVGFTRVVNLTALQPGTLYYWRVRVQLGTNCSSTPIISATQSFSTLAAPTPSVPSISSIGSTVSSNSATISYNLNANFGTTTSLINYGLSSGNLSSQVTGASASGSAATPASTNIIGLTPQTVYYYQIVATNSVGTTSSSVLSFTTSAVFVPQIIAEYDFDNTYNNILGGNPFTANAGTSFVTGRNGITNGALNMNSTGSTATITGLPYGSSPRTITFWAKVNVMRTDFNMTFSYGQSSTANACGGSFRGDNAMFLGYNNNLTASNSNVAGTWYYFTYTYDGTTAKIYKNGILAGSGAYAWSTLNNSDLFKLGTGVGGELWFNGAIDELKIYNYAIPASEVVYLYNDSPCAGVGVNAPTNTTPAQNLTICSGQSATLTATANGVIDWTGAGTGTGTIFVTPTLTANATFSITNTVAGCTSPVTVVTVTINGLTPPVFTGSSSTSICSGTSTSLTASGTGTISWYASSTATTALTTGTVFTTPTLTSNTSYYISATTNGCESPRAVKTITITPLPAQPVNLSSSIGLQNNVCSGNIAEFYVGTNCDWYISATGGTSFLNSNSYSTPTLTTTTTYYVDRTVNGCTSAPRVALVATVNPMPSVLSQTVQNLTCNGSGNGSISLTLNNPSSFSYDWTPNVSATYSATSLSAGIYTVQISSGAGLCATTQTYNVTQPAAYNVPVNVLANGTILGFGDSYTGSPSFQWVDCNNSNAPIAGATNATFTPTITGSYALTFGYSGCVSTSTCNVITVTTTGLNENTLLNAISLQPNPASTFFTLNNVVEGTSVNVMDVTGKIVASSSVIDADKTMTIETSNLSNGIYIIQLNNNGAVAHKKLIVSK